MRILKCRLLFYKMCCFAGLFDEPVVREGKRQRHAVERLAAVSSPSPRKTSLDAVGSGTSLGDIEFGNVYRTVLNMLVAEMLRF